MKSGGSQWNEAIMNTGVGEMSHLTILLAVYWMAVV